MSQKLSLSKETLQVLSGAHVAAGMLPGTTRMDKPALASDVATGCYFRCGATPLPVSIVRVCLSYVGGGACNL